MLYSPEEIAELVQRQMPRTLTDGTVTHLEGQVAYVVVRGSTRPERARASAGIPVEPGDHVLLFRPEGLGEWLVAANFSRGQQQAASRAGGDIHIFRSTAGVWGQAIADDDNLKTIASLPVTLRRGKGMVAFSGFARFSGSGSVTLSYFLRANGRDLALFGSATRMKGGTGFPTLQSVSALAPFDLPPGSCTFSLEIGPDVAQSGTLFYLSSFFVMEI